MTKIKFGSWEAITLLINLIFVQVLLSFPRDVAQYGGSAGWMIPLIATLIIVIYFAITAALYKNIGSLDLIDISEKVGGRTLKIIMGLLIVFFLFFELAINLGGFAQVLKMISLDKSPLGFVELLFFFGIIVAAFYGIEAVARISAFLLPLIVAGFLIITLGVIPKYHIDNLFPIFGQGYWSIAMGSLYKLSAYSPLIILFLMVPFFSKQHLKKVGYMSILMAGLLLIWSTLSFLLLYPYQIAVDNRIPIFQMAKHIEFGNVQQRVESIFVLVCSISSLLYLGVIFAFLIFIMQKTLSLKKSKPLVLPVAILAFTAADGIKRMNLDIINSFVGKFIWLFGLVLPLIIIILGAAKKVGRKQEGGRTDNE